MESEDEAKAAIAALDGHSIHGTRITVEVRTFLILIETFFIYIFHCFKSHFVEIIVIKYS